MHKVRKVKVCGRFTLYECLGCKDRNLALTRREAREIYSKVQCSNEKSISSETTQRSI